MNDFLQSIRNQSKDKRYQSNNRPRRPYDNGPSGSGSGSGSGSSQSSHHHNQQNHHNSQQNQQSNQGSYNRGNDNYHRSNDNRSQDNRSQDNRKYQPRPRTDVAPPDENLGMIKELLETLVAQQGQVIEVHERRAMAEERKAEAIEEIASVISALAGTEFPVMDKVISGIDDVAREFEDEIALDDDEAMLEEPEEGGLPSIELSKDEIVSLIHKMRSEGSTYNEVAAHLTGIGLATFSGRGKWHAQTIHRLCQQE